MKQNLALFDFDGTISRKDSMIEFLKFYKGKRKVILAFVQHIHWLVLMYLGLVENWKVKEKIWVALIGNTKLESFNKSAEKFSLEVLSELIYEKALNQIKKHQNNNDRVIIISASAENWLKPWCEVHQLELISTQLEVENEVITGRLKGNNCNGNEKVNRIKQVINLNDYEEIYAYGNSSGDKEMLALATHSHYKVFK